MLLVFLEPEFWWFDEYPDFMTHVGSISRLVFTDRLAKAFELRTPAQQ